MNKLLKDAIADAKAVRETALANAKLALEEAFAPKLQSMLSSKIREEMEEDGMEEEESEVDPNRDRRDVGHGDTADDVNMESRFKSLAGISEEEGEEGSEEDFSDESEEDYSDEGGEEFSDESESEEDYSDESDEDLEEILRELDAEEGEEAEEPAEDEEMDLDEIINALREEEGNEGGEDMDPNAKNTDNRDIEEEIDLQELLNSLNEEEGEEKEEKEEKEEVEEGKMKKKMNKMEEELNEAYSAVKFLRTKLSEVNLLNAKLLYVNKLFRNNLTETQKVKIIETFDRAKTVREAKLVFATLSESLNATKGSTKQNATKKSVMESFASKATAKTKSVLNEGNDQANRFKKLAGII